MSSSSHNDKQLIKPDSFDLNNINYDSVLQLYKSFKSSESELREKTQELISIKKRLNDLQESHYKFRGQIQALESVKELTITLQSELSILQKENQKLLKDNVESVELNEQAEVLLRERIEKEAIQTKLIVDLRNELSSLTKKYEELSENKKEIDEIASDEQAARLILDTKLKIANETIEQFKHDNRTLKNQYDITSIKLSKCDDELAHASEQLMLITREIQSIKQSNDKLHFYEKEVGVLKGDISRLIHLIEFYPALQGFKHRWLDSNGMSFVGLGKSLVNSNADKSLSMRNNSQNITSVYGTNSHVLTEFDDIDLNDDKQYNDDYDEYDIGLHKFNSGTDFTPAEYDRLKNTFNGDPFPITSNMEVRVY